MASNIVSQVESTIEKHIDSTSRLVRRVDIALSLLIVFSLILGGLFLAIIADHWLLKEGLSVPLRFGIFFALFAATALYTYRNVVPLFLYPINPVYTANLIEQDAPSFKNSLINWLLLRQERSERSEVPKDKIGERMYDGIVRTAAVNVKTVPAEHPVDFRKLIWSGTFFAVLLLTFAGYAALSPKSLWASTGRIFFPFGNIAPPQIAQFRNVKPGNAAMLQGETTIISAEVVSPSAEPVYLVFSTDDGQAVQQRIPMSQQEGKNAHETPFPPGKQGSERGFNSSVDYWIVQGESRSQQYRIDVLPAASVEIVSLQYDFPNYTGLPQEIIDHGGDIKALEGTVVTASVRSTLPLQKIDLLFGDNGRDDDPAVGMKITNDQKTEARGTFTLKYPFPHQSFALRATDENGNASRRSGIYRIEVVPDLPPKVQWADTATHLKEPRIDLPINKTLSMPIQAEDPDFALRYLHFKTVSTTNSLIRIPDLSLLESPPTGPTEHRRQITKTVAFSPAERRLSVGDTVEVWVEAKDTKYPEANIGSTTRIVVNVVAPAEEEEKGDDPNNEQEQKANEGDSSKRDDKQDKGADATDEKDQQEGDKSDNPEQPQEQNPKEKQPEQNNPEQTEGNQNQDGSSGGGQSGENQEDGSNKGKAGNEPGEGGENGEGNEQDSGNQNGRQDGDSDPSNQQSQGDPQGTGKGGERQGAEKGSGQGNREQGGTEQEGTEQGQEGTVDPETQSGDAMERIVEQMKKEGKFNEDEVTDRLQNKRDQGQENNKPGTPDQSQRDNTLHPNSQNRRNEGNDPSNPRQSNQRQANEKSPDNNPQNNNPQGNPDSNNNDNPKNEGACPSCNGAGCENCGGGNPGQQGDAGKEPGESGGEQQGTEDGDGSAQGAEQQNGNQRGTQGSQNAPGQQGAPGEQGTSGNQQQRQQGGGGEPEQQQQPGDQSGSPPHSPQDGNGSQSGGGTGGGTGPNAKTTADDPNLQYANEVTNLVLEYLEDQLKDQPNEDLLKKLNWTPEQLKQFYDKWKKMSEESRRVSGTEDGKDAWAEALKSIGLRPNRQGTGSRANPTAIKDRGHVTEGIRHPPPPALNDRFKEYNDRIGR